MAVPSSSFKAAQEFTKSKYGKPRKPVHWSNVHCNGDEQQISLCEHHAFSPLDYKKFVLGLIDVAGVKCLLTITETPTSMNETIGTSAGPSEQTSPEFKAPTYLTMLTPTSPSFPLHEYKCTAPACLLAYEQINHSANKHICLLKYLDEKHKWLYTTHSLARINCLEARVYAKV